MVSLMFSRDIIDLAKSRGCRYDLYCLIADPNLRSIYHPANFLTEAEVEAISVLDRAITESQRKPEKYFITQEREVTKEEYVRAERDAGFYNTLDEPNEPATSSFGNKGISGRVEYA